VKQRINFIDALFSNEGHYIDDINKYSYLALDYDLHYFVNGKISEKNKTFLEGFTVHESTGNKSIFGLIMYLRTVRKQISRKDFNFVMSVKYLSLFIFSITSNFYNFFLLVHFFPTSKIFLNRIVLRFLLLKSNGFMVLDKSVKLHLESIIGKNGNVNVIRSRDIEISDENEEKKASDKLVLTFVGAMNSYKDVSLLIELLTENYYSNIEFRFFSKGISFYIKGLLEKNFIVVKDEYFSKEDYKRYLQESDYIYLAYYSNYGVRFSGMAFDALSNACPVICNDNPSFHFLNQYNACEKFSNKFELDDILINLSRKIPDGKIYKDFSRGNREAEFLTLVKKFFHQI